MRLLPAKAGPGSVPDGGEPQAEVPLVRLGMELRTLALAAVLLLLVSSAWSATGAVWLAESDLLAAWR